MTLSAVMALLLLEAKHFLFDFPLQTQYQSSNKGTYGHPGGILHAGLHSVGTAAVLACFSLDIPLLFAILAAEFLIHYHVDWTKAQLVKRIAPERNYGFWLIFGLDQFLHHATYVAIVFAMFSR